MSKHEILLTVIFCVTVFTGYLCYNSWNKRVVEIKRQETLQQSFELLAKANELYIRSNTLLAKIAEALEVRAESVRDKANED